MVDLNERAYLWKVDAKRVHIHAIQERREILAEASKTFVHQLKVHKVRL